MFSETYNRKSQHAKSSFVAVILSSLTVLVLGGYIVDARRDASCHVDALTGRAGRVTVDLGKTAEASK